jgi:hypothetical protein
MNNIENRIDGLRSAFENLPGILQERVVVDGKIAAGLKLKLLTDRLSDPAFKDNFFAGMSSEEFVMASELNLKNLSEDDWYYVIRFVQPSSGNSEWEGKSSREILSPAAEEIVKGISSEVHDQIGVNELDIVSEGGSVSSTGYDLKMVVHQLSDVIRRKYAEFPSLHVHSAQGYIGEAKLSKVIMDKFGVELDKNNADDIGKFEECFNFLDEGEKMLYNVGLLDAYHEVGRKKAYDMSEEFYDKGDVGQWLKCGLSQLYTSSEFDVCYRHYRHWVYVPVEGKFDELDEYLVENIEKHRHIAKSNKYQSMQNRITEIDGENFYKLDASFYLYMFGLAISYGWDSGINLDIGVEPSLGVVDNLVEIEEQVEEVSPVVNDMVNLYGSCIKKALEKHEVSYVNFRQSLDEYFSLDE